MLLIIGLINSLSGDEEAEELDEEYRTLTIKLQDYTVTREFTAKIETENPATIRPQISGKITKICVKEGARLKKGQPLFVIDQAPYQAAVRSAEAKVASAKAQNSEAAIGTLGKNSKHTFQYTMVYRGRLLSEEEFGNIVIKSLPEGEDLRLRDVARCELGAENYATDSWINGHNGTVAFITQKAGSNARQVNIEIDELMEHIRPHLPPGVEFKVLLDSNDFLNASMAEVYETLVEAILLVVLVVLLFLQNYRATLIPAFAIIVSLLTTFAFMYLIGITTPPGSTLEQTKKTVLQARQEVNNVLATRQYNQRAIKQISQQVEKLTDVLDATEKRMNYDSEVNYLQVLLARQALLEARLSLLSHPLQLDASLKVVDPFSEFPWGHALHPSEETSKGCGLREMQAVSYLDDGE